MHTGILFSLVIIPKLYSSLAQFCSMPLYGMFAMLHGCRSNFSAGQWVFYYPPRLPLSIPLNSKPGFGTALLVSDFLQGYQTNG